MALVSCKLSEEINGGREEQGRVEGLAERLLPNSKDFGCYYAISHYYSI